MKIIDSHVHFWHPEKLRYAWLDGSETLNKPTLPADYDSATGDVEVSGIVFVQANCADTQNIQEAEWVAELDERVRAIVAFAPLENGDSARDQLETLAAHPKVKGIRRLIQSEELGFSIQPKFIEGVQALADYDLSFDICVLHNQLPDVLQLVEHCPNVRFVLDHGGKPGIKAGLHDPWRQQITQLAGFDNVDCKISGLITEADHDNWTTDQLRPYIDHLLKSFGASRLMFGSDFPVLNLAGDFTRWFETLQTLLSDLSDDEKTAIYAETATRFYGI